MGEKIAYKIRKDFTGQKIGMFTVIGLAHIRNNRSYWVLRCECGTEKIRLIKKVNSLKYTSCGCEFKTALSEMRKTHGMSGHPAFHVWDSMVDRCTLPTHQAWHNYGARGVTVCQRWVESFENFWEDMGNDYQYGLSLDRKNVNGNYEKDNCRWITMKEQSRNKRNNILIQTEWGLITVAEAAERIGIGPSTIHYRLKKNWPENMLLIKPDFARRIKATKF